MVEQSYDLQAHAWLMPVVEFQRDLTRLCVVPSIDHGHPLIDRIYGLEQLMLIRLDEIEERLRAIEEETRGA